MKRILVFNDGLVLGGTEKLLVELLNHWALKCEVTLLLPYQSSQNVLLSNLHSSIKVNYLFSEKQSSFSQKLEENVLIFFPGIYQSLKKIKAKDYDCVICFKECIYARLFSVMPIQKILWVHNMLYKRTYKINSFRERVAVWLKKKQLKVSQKSYDRYDTVFCVSEACRKSYLEVLHSGQQNGQDIRILYNAIDTEPIILKAQADIPPIDQSVINFVLVTRNSPEKRIDRLINATERLAADGYNFHIYLIGEGMNSDKMKSIVSSRNLINYITLIGSIDNPYPYLLQCNWALCVSERESFSLTILEAMILNTPVISTNCGGPADVLVDGKYGILVDNSSKGVYEGMKQVLDNKMLSVKYSSHLREAVERFDYHRWIDTIDKTIRC